MVTLDNFGIFLAGHLGAPTGGRNVTMIDKTGANQTVKVIGTSTNQVWGEVTAGTPTQFIQVGKGTTPVTRQDIAIESPFTTAPESTRFATIPAGYNSGLGKVTFSGTIGATGGSGSVTEVTKESRIKNTGNLLQDFLYFRDIISPASFIIGQAINVSYEVFI